MKAQVPTGRRGKAGGIAVVSAANAVAACEALLGRQIAGFDVPSVLVEELVEARSELYVAVSIDARARSPLLLFSTRGGVEIDEHAADVARVEFPMRTGVRAWHVWRAVHEAGGGADVATSVLNACVQAFRLFASCRADLVELNPLLLTSAGDAVAVDVRISFDGDSEAAAKGGRDSSRSVDGYDFVEIDPEGDTGLITTGAGASMLLLDRLKDAGAQPINFCDLRTGGLHGKSDRLEDVLGRLCGYPEIRTIAVNVFAGITDLLEFAELFVAAYRKVGPELPTLVRVEGRNAEEARSVFASAGLTCVGGFDELVAVVGAMVSDWLSSGL